MSVIGGVVETELPDELGGQVMEHSWHCFVFKEYLTKRQPTDLAHRSAPVASLDSAI